jgi:hypothetical protein
MPVEPDVYRNMAGSFGSGMTVSNSPASRKASNDSAPSPPNTAAGRPGGQLCRRGASQNTNFAPQSRKMSPIVAGGNLKFTGTATKPARMIPK